MKHSLVINSEQVAKRACDLIRALPLDHPHEVVIRPVEKNRSAAQNALYWMWVTILSGETGETKDEVHTRLKKKHLVRIYERDNEGYGKMVAAIRTIHRSGMKTEAGTMAAEIIRLTSTTDATVQQFTEYLNDIDMEAISQGFVLPHPEDKYIEAMGL